MVKRGSKRLMTHKTVTPEPQENMPRQQGLLRRGARFYSNFKVPKDLRESLQKEHIREALGTSDYREACRKMAFERMRWQSAFDDERRKLNAAKPETKRKRVLLTVTEREAYEMAARYLVKLERKFRGFWEREGIKMEDAEKQEIIGTVSADGEGYPVAPSTIPQTMRRFPCGSSSKARASNARLNARPSRLCGPCSVRWKQSTQPGRWML